MDNKKTFVLVHGAWVGGWCWDPIVNILTSLGHTVYAPTMPGLGDEDPNEKKAITLSDHVNSIVKLIKNQNLSDIILVAHSYGGAVITGVADRMKDYISKLVYIDAFILQNGQSVLSLNKDEDQVAIVKQAKENNGTVPPVFGPQDLGAIGPEVGQALMTKMRFQPLNTFVQQLGLANEVGNNLPLTYIAFDQPELVQIKPFVEYVRNKAEWKFYSIKAGHMGIMTHPSFVADLLLAE
ncbi:alpha/beta fold hydrolase [Sphingobacterium siyangense]|uniref:Pimeloyl-ACP methyl ester carboxylesterase n=1 Tax=Sphingobacterium siyangense TaxID=459529 RepID=A0A562M0D1_9SPHI|nr:alpha/beta hydrolase [Sphingobacterium siyangense]TWI13071.1 pimeloyl-ACP methyl ester carboxylesterase [Sphingobacterium siyangense]